MIWVEVDRLGREAMNIVSNVGIKAAKHGKCNAGTTLARKGLTVVR